MQIGLHATGLRGGPHLNRGQPFGLNGASPVA